MSSGCWRCFLIGLGLVLGPAWTLARGGSDETHAGDVVVLEFFNLAKSQAQVLSQMPTDFLPSQGFAQKYKNKMDQMIVRSEESVFFNGQEVNAINYPRRMPPEIVISRRLWNLIPETYEQHDLLTLHEMIYLVGLNDDGFRMSTDLYPVLQLYRETSVAKILKKYIISQSSHLRNEAFQRLERSDLVFDQAAELLYNLSRWAIIEKGENGDFLTALTLTAMKTVSRLVFLTSFAGCSVDFLEQNPRQDAKKALAFLRAQGVSRTDPVYCSSLEYR